MFNEHAGHGGNYQSWNYYHEDFGIYDDDVEIVTLDQAEFQQRLAQLYLKCVEIFFLNSHFYIVLRFFVFFTIDSQIKI